MFEKLSNFFNKMTKPEVKELASKDAAKERLHLVLMQDRANVSVDFLELMKQEIIDVIKKYIVVDENAIDVRLTNQENEDGTNGAPSLYANIPILNIKNDVKAEKIKDGTLIYENGEEKNLAQDNSAEEQQEVVEETANIEVIELGEPAEVSENTEEIVQAVEPQEEQNVEEQVQEVAEEPKEQEISEENVESAETDEVQEENVFDDEEISTVDVELEAENVEPILDFADDEDDDDDVTFDDLLKKAEEEEAIQNDEKSEEKKSASTKGINQKPIRSKKSSGAKQKKR